jgi:phosphohistidine phosphatase
LLRHAKTLQDPPAGGADRDRRLAPRGERDADAMGARLAADSKRGKFSDLDGVPRPGLVLSSSATRAAQTAERVWAAVPDPPPIRYLDSLYAATPREVLRQVSQAGPELPAVMVVGHNPTAQELAIELVDRHDKPGRKLLERQTLATCALVVYRFRAKTWADLDLGEGSVVAFLVPPY